MGLYAGRAGGVYTDSIKEGRAGMLTSREDARYDHPDSGRRFAGPTGDVMASTHGRTSGLDAHGIATTGQVHWNLTAPLLYEHAIRRNEGAVAADGPLVCRTGRTPAGRRTTSSSCRSRRARPTSSGARSTARCRPSTSPPCAPTSWRTWREGPVRAGPVRRRRPGLPPAGALRERAAPGTACSSATCSSCRRTAELRGVRAASSPSSARRRSRPTRPATARAPRCVIALNMSAKEVLIGGTSYAGENKKSIFTRAELPAAAARACCRCTARRTSAQAGDTALFFGLSGTGKTTLSSDPERRLIGDDEHGWSDRGVFNFEGGCYAKMIRLSAEAEPQIYAHHAALRHGARERRDRPRHARARFRRSRRYTENTRARVSDRVHRQRTCLAGRAAIRRTS